MIGRGRHPSPQSDRWGRVRLGRTRQLLPGLNTDRRRSLLQSTLTTHTHKNPASFLVTFTLCLKVFRCLEGCENHRVTPRFKVAVGQKYM